MIRYTWDLSVWDQTGNISKASSWFETGFLNPSVSAWSGAQWIGGDDDLILQSDYLSVFRLKYTVQLDAKSKSSRASFALGANNPCLMDKNRNLFALENGVGQSYILLTLDVSLLIADPQAQAKIEVYGVGYHKDDKRDSSFFNIPSNLINISNMRNP